MIRWWVWRNVLSFKSDAQACREFVREHPKYWKLPRYERRAVLREIVDAQREARALANMVR